MGKAKIFTDLRYNRTLLRASVSKQTVGAATAPLARTTSFLCEMGKWSWPHGLNPGADSQHSVKTDQQSLPAATTSMQLPGDVSLRILAWPEDRAA